MRYQTAWEVEQRGGHTGPQTAGKIIGGAVDYVLETVRTRKIAAPEPAAKSWPTWREGEAMPMPESWPKEMVAAGRLADTQYQARGPGEVGALILSGRWEPVIVLDKAAKTRHRVVACDSILLAKTGG
jgi:hypothetical protein